MSVVNPQGSAIATGKTVQITRGSDTRTYSSWGQAASISINAETSTDRLVGEAVWFPEPTVSGFTATGFNHSRGTIYDNRLHDIYCKWDFGRDHTFQYIENVLDEWKNSRTSYGPFTATAFNSAGTFSVGVEALDGQGGYATDTYSYTAVDHATAFPGTQTIALDPSGAFTGAPVGCTQVTTWTAAMTAYRALRTAGQKGRLVFPPGATINLDSVGTFLINANYPNWVLTPWGPGRTTIQLTDSAATADGSTLFSHQTSFSALGGSALYMRLDFAFPWDATTETGRAMTAIGLDMSNQHTTINDCSFRGCRTAVGSSGALNLGTMKRILFDCDIEGWQDFGVYDDADTNVAAYIGTRLVQDVDAYMGAGNKVGAPNRRNDHGPTRNQAGQYYLFDACDMFSRNAWELTRNPPNVQPAGRVVPSNEGAKVSIGRTSMEAGNVVLLLGSRTDFNHAQNIVVDKAILLGSSRTGSDIISSSNTGITVRNVLAILPDVDYTQPTDYFFSGRNSNASQVTAECTLAGRDYYNNTLLYLVSDVNEAADPNWIRVQADYPAHYQNISVENNVYVAPNSTAMGLTATAIIADFDGTTLFAPRWKGHRYQSYVIGGSTNVPAQLTMDTTFATPADTVKDMTPTANQQSITAGKIAFDDIRGVPRYDATTKLFSGAVQGAFQP